VKTGRGAHFGGLAAEEIAERLYLAEGATLEARRWRCAEGEIDLILRTGEGLVFVEVKARRGHAAAAVAISPAQWRRIGAAASRYLAETTDGSVPCRFDVVLVDRSGAAERIENAASFET
jgi:putative endonuclease